MNHIIMGADHKNIRKTIVAPKQFFVDHEDCWYTIIMILNVVIVSDKDGQDFLRFRF